MDAVLSVSRSAPHLLASSPELTAAASKALLHIGEAQGALQLLQRPASAREASPGVRSACHTSTAEVYLLNGRLADAVAAARAGLEYAGESRTDRFRACTLLAAGYALSGERRTASDWLVQAIQLDHDNQWRSRSWPFLLAALQIHTQSLDKVAIESALHGFSSQLASQPVERALIGLGSTWRHMILGDYRHAFALADTITHGVDSSRQPPLLVDLALSSQALSMIHLGDPGTAFSLAAEKRSLPGHTVCFELIRAGLHLLVQEPREALAATDVCVKHTPDHSLLTLASVLLRRAVSHEMLGERHLADASFSRSVHLAAETAGLRPAVGLPLQVLETLYWRMVDNEPDFAPVLMSALPPEGKYPDRADLTFTPVRLSKRERVLAQWLPTELPLPGIAKELCVSVNTIKTQAKSLYRKLDVASRAEAVERLGRTGMIGYPHPRAGQARQLARKSSHTGSQATTTC